MGGIVDELIPNEKNYVFHETRYPGGNGINAARIIQRLGGAVVSTGFLGGSIGQEMAALLNTEGLSHDFIKIEAPTRISVTVSNLKSSNQTRLSFPGPTICHSDWKNLMDFVSQLPRESLAVIGGSLPVGVDAELLKELIFKLNSRNIQCIVDVPGKYLNAITETNALFIKPNLVEFQELTNKNVSSIDDVTKVAKKLLSKIPMICVSSVENGALLVTEKGVYFGRIPAVEIRTTVGAGDSMVGAMTAKLAQLKAENGHDSYLEVGLEYGQDLLKWGLAAACATLTVQGTQLGSVDNILKYLEQISIKKIE